MRQIVAQGTFDLLHTGHLHYLREAAALGDELVVIIARRSNVTHKPEPILPAVQRCDLIDALEMVDRAMLGHEHDIFVPIERLAPDCIVLGHDQHHSETDLRDELVSRGLDIEVRRASAYEPRSDDELLSSGDIVDRILDRRGNGVSAE